MYDIDLEKTLDIIHKITVKPQNNHCPISLCVCVCVCVCVYDANCTNPATDDDDDSDDDDDNDDDIEHNKKVICFREISIYNSVTSLHTHKPIHIRV